jgi:hypothetical protein
MPLQNRVTPFGEIVAVPERGLFIGNRGIIHDPATRTLLGRRWTSRAWLVCVCEYKGIRRRVMGPGSWTELFFLDEATALGAGHRPCFECRRRDAEAFRAAWARGRGADVPKAPAMDLVLHQERLSGWRKRLHALPGTIEALPDGAMIAAGDAAFLIAAGRPRRWTPGGYEPAKALHGEPMLLTPPSTLGALQSGYRPVLHPSASGVDGRDRSAP